MQILLNKTITYLVSTKYCFINLVQLHFSPVLLIHFCAFNDATIIGFKNGFIIYFIFQLPEEICCWTWLENFNTDNTRSQIENQHNNLFWALPPTTVCMKAILPQLQRIYFLIYFIKSLYEWFFQRFKFRYILYNYCHIK